MVAGQRITSLAVPVTGRRAAALLGCWAAQYSIMRVTYGIMPAVRTGAMRIG